MVLTPFTSSTFFICNNKQEIHLKAKCSDVLYPLMNSLTFKLYQVTIVTIEGGWKQFSKTTSNFIQSTSNPTFPLYGQPISHMLSHGLKFEIVDVA